MDDQQVRYQNKSTANVFVVLNPVAGHSDPESIREVLDQFFSQWGWCYQLYETTGSEQLSEVIGTALKQDFDLFVAAGGDGTVAGVGGGLVRAGLPLGIIPVGTSNALAKELNIPLDMEKAVRLLAGDYAISWIDTMQVQEQYFILNVTVGVSSLIIRATGREGKRRFGRLAYLWSGVRGLFGYQPRDYRVRIDGRTHRFRASELAVLNAGILVGSPFRWGPDIHLNDGELNVAVIRIRTFFDYFRLAGDVMLGRQKQAPNARYLKVNREIEIDADRPLIVQADGEVIGQTPLEVKLVPTALPVIVPKGSDRNDR